MLVEALRNQIKSTINCGASTGFRWLLNNSFYDYNSKNKDIIDSALNILANYIQTANLDGNYLDLPSMGEYIHFLNSSLSLAIW
jgi:hypothetical protein